VKYSSKVLLIHEAEQYDIMQDTKDIGKNLARKCCNNAIGYNCF
jgi:hypothetical protein